MQASNQRPMSDIVQDMLSKLEGLQFHRPGELADFFMKENVQFSASDLNNFRHILVKQLGGSERLARGIGLYDVPSWLYRVFSAFVEDTSPTTICDPWAGVGFLIGVLNDASKAKTALAFTPDRGEATLGKVLVPYVDWQCGDPLLLFRESKTELDVVASILPMSVRSRDFLRLTLPSGVRLNGDLGNLVLVAASMHLGSSGVGLFVVTSAFFLSRSSVFRWFSEFGLGVEAALALPAGTFYPYTTVPSYLVIVRRRPLERMFVAQLSADTSTNLQIIDNFRQEREGTSLELGRFVSPESFRSIGAIRAEEMVTLAEQRFGAPFVRLDELSTAINMGRFGEDFAFHPLENAIFVPLIGNSDVMQSPDDLTLKNQNYAQVVIDPTRSNAGFVARFLNSEFGKQLRDQKRKGFVIPKLNKRALGELRTFIPNLQTQRRMLEIETGITAEHNTVMALQNELAELRRELWTNPNTVPNIEQRLGGLVKRLAAEKQYASKSLGEWFETLPFPLASILRAWQATSSQDFKTKYEHLLHFFEGTAEFVSVILLSAFSSNVGAFEKHKQKLLETMAAQNLSFERATFGTWKLVVEYLGKQTRDLLDENEKDPKDAENDRSLCANLFADPSLSLPRALSHKNLADIFSVTNKMRNNWKGHGGVVGQEEAELRNQQLLGEVLRLREVIADAWTKTQLIHASHCCPRRGMFENEIAILMGSNSEFLTRTCELATWLDVESLYLLNEDSRQALKLLPLVRIGPPP